MVEINKTKWIEFLSFTDDNSKHNILKNKRFINNIGDILAGSSAFKNTVLPKNQSNLIIHLAINFPDIEAFQKNRSTVSDLIVSNEITKMEQLEMAFKYFEQKKTFDKTEFETFCGIGVSVSREEIELFVDQVIKEHEAALLESKWDVFPSLRAGMMKKLKQKLQWADGKTRTQIFNEKIEALIGPKPSGKSGKIGADGMSSKANIKEPANEPRKTANEKDKDLVEVEGAVGLQKYLSGRKLSIACNSVEVYAEHLKRTDNVFRTRFPPEPNGYLHIGHAKSINFNFSLAKEKGGVCILRFDDTNPLAEEQEYIDSIIDNVAWLGFTPAMTTFSSDYFEELYGLALKMINKGFAYVCNESQEQIKKSRDHRIKTKEVVPSPYRDRTIEENLALFEKMRDGHFKPGEATLRMKGDLSNHNPNMWDPVAYRIIDHPHPHVGSKWRIYPSYDFTHCIVDSLEDIDASCCTLEFENRRESYFWLLDVLEMYKPVVWEFSRLNMEHNIMSKRRLNALVEDKHVMGWDDPRLFTINGMRRRGVPAVAINNFCEKIGVTRAENSISPSLLNACTSEILDKISVRTMCVLDPLKVVLTNFDENRVEKIRCVNFPTDKENSPYHFSDFKKEIYIEKTDFRLEDSKKFYGLTPGKTVRLKYAYNITCDEVVWSGNEISHLLCTADLGGEKKVKKGVLHWVPISGNKRPEVEIRLFEDLFTEKKPGSGDKPWIEEINKNSVKIITGAIPSQYVIDTASKWSGQGWECRFQFERVGYFCKDQDSDENKLVLNRILPLRESKEKLYV